LMALLEILYLSAKKFSMDKIIELGHFVKILKDIFAMTSER